MLYTNANINGESTQTTASTALFETYYKHYIDAPTVNFGILSNLLHTLSS